VLQPLLLDLSRSFVKDRNLLKSCVKITAYNQHDVGSFSSLGLFSRKPIYSYLRANVVMQSSEAVFQAERSISRAPSQPAEPGI
jgi:hypothetical protein